MVPTWRFVALLLVTGVPLALSAWWPNLLWVAVGWLLLILAIVLVDLRLTPRADQWTLARTHDTRLSVAAWNRVEVQVRLGQGLRGLPVWLRDLAPSSFAVTDTLPPSPPASRVTTAVALFSVMTRRE